MTVDPDTAETEYGPIIRHLLPGESFGELALLQRRAHRTATVIVGRGDEDMGDSGVPHSVYASLEGIPSSFSATSVSHGGGAGVAGIGHGMDAIRIPRHLFDATVTSVQVSQLEERLSFLMTFKVSTGLFPPAWYMRHPHYWSCVLFLVQLRRQA